VATHAIWNVCSRQPAGRWRALAFWTDKNLIVREHALRDLRIRRFRITYEGRSFFRRLKQAMEAGTIPRPDPEVVETDDDPETDDPWLKEYLQSDESRSWNGRARQNASARRRSIRSGWHGVRNGGGIRRLRLTPIATGWNSALTHPARRSASMEERQPAVNGVTYLDQWSPQLSNSGKTPRWAGWLTGSDGSHHTIVDEHINNRRNDPDRNWGLPE
jgi:hypothetical protein